VLLYYYNKLLKGSENMNLEQIKEKVKSPEYDFLRTNEHLGNNIVLLGLGGSHAYGMNKESSDIDIRGLALNSKKEILLSTDFEEVVNTDTDTTVYSFNKMITLLTKLNPNTCEILGLEDWQYLYLHPVGKELINNKKMFLSKICIHTFGGYANSQLRRLENKAARLVGQAQNEEYILRSINNAQYDFKHRYFPHNEGAIKLYTDTAVQEGYESEIFMDVNLPHYPLRDWAGMWNEMKAIVSSYNKIGKRNEKAMSHDKLGKHSAHLIRLFMMVIDILEKEEIITYRREEHDLLMSIRNGEWLDDNRQPIPEFYDLVNEYEKRFEYAKQNTSLPDLPDYKKINEFKMDINEGIVKGEFYGDYFQAKRAFL
jgi:predicted nucleotidyltransferase